MLIASRRNCMKYTLQKILLAILTIGLIYACGGSKKVSSTKQKTSYRKKNISESKLRNNLVKTAKKYNGVRYKAAGTTKSGMDCSGLVFTVFQENDIALPRSSVEQSRIGKDIKLKNVQIGDLLFFQNNPKKKEINHVGMVIDFDGDEILFIHSSTQKGVIVSSLNEAYHSKTFIKAKDVIQ